MTSLTNVPNRLGQPVAERVQRWRWSLGLTIAALAIGSFRLGDKGLWLDEIASLNFALGGPEVWFADHNMSLYYALLAGMIRLFGRGELALRGLSVACFVAGALVVYALAGRLFGERAARSASALFVLNATLVHFAQEARGYMLALLLLGLASLLLVRLIGQPRPGFSIGYGLVAGLALYAHLFAVWVALAQGLFALYACARRAAPWRPVLLAFLVLGACAVPLGLGVLERGTGQISWIYPPTPARLWAGLSLLSGGSALLCALELGLFALFAARALRSPDALAQRLLIVWWLVPVLASYTFSWLVSPIVHPKYLLVIVPALLLGCAGALERLDSRALRGVLLAALFALSLARLYVWYAEQQRELWREAVALLAARAERDDVLVLDVMLAEPLDYYVERTGVAARMPRLLWPARSWGLPPPPERPLSPTALRGALSAAPRVWLVRNRSDAFDPREWLSATHRLAETVTLEPRDDDAQPPLFADPRGRVITLLLFTRTEPPNGAGS